jgi:CHAT domain-containing protein/Tfp pilus assembly protein PilF
MMCLQAVLTGVIGILTCLPIGAAVGPVGQTPEHSTTLKPGVPVEREISGREKHVYSIELQPGQLATIDLEERGTDLVLEVLTGDGSVTLEANDQWGNGREALEVIAEEGRTTVAVRARYSGPSGGKYAIKLAAMRASTAHDRTLHEARKLRTQGSLFERRREFDKSLGAFERALSVAEGVLPQDDPFLALLRMDVGMHHFRKENLSAALPMFQRSFDVLTTKLGPDRQATMYVQSRVGAVHAELGDHKTAERLLTDALHRQESTVGRDHPLVAYTLTSLGLLLFSRGDYKEAERAHQRVLAIFSKWYGTDTSLFAMAENNLGVLYLSRRDYERAAQHFDRSLSIREKLLGPDDAELAEVVQNLGIVARERKDYAAAVRYYERALAMRERSVGLDHPIVAGTLNNLANVYGAQGDYERSLATHLRALGISEQHATKWQQPILSLGNIARTYAARGDFSNALKFQSRVEAAIEVDMALNLAIGSERQKIAYLNRMAERTDRTISFHLQLQPESQEAARLALRALLQRKGRVLDAMSNAMEAVHLHASGEERALLDRLADTTKRLARLALGGPGKTTLGEHRRTLQQLDDAKEMLEADLSRRNEEFSSVFLRVTVEGVEAAVPPGAALLEFAVYRPFNPKAESMTVAYGSPRYAVFVLGGKKTLGRDLGEAAAIDAAIQEYRAALQDPASDNIRRAARALDEKVMQPIRAQVGDATRLLIAPDGQLALIPFEALRDPEGRYLIERSALTYLSAGRDLLRMQVDHGSGTAPVVVADPLFGEPAAASDASNSAPSASSTTARRSITSGADLRSMYFAPLAGTLHEARSLQSVFPDAKVLTGAGATESALKRVQAPRILHIATHGFFLEAPHAGTVRGGPPPTGTRAIQAAPAGIENPLLRSGLALAGANLTSGDKEDGILTALEAAHLNLWGTRLVTLSACDTGIGVVRNGDGVYGLRRSIFLAGAEALVMSLWPVSDYVTREMMTAYYKGLNDGLGRGAALRQVQLSLLKRRNRSHPFYWASFIQAGEWASLDGRR